MISYIIFLFISSSWSFFFYKLYNRELFHPVILFNIYWLVVLNSGILFSMLFDFYFFYEGIYVIFLHVICFSLGGLGIKTSFPRAKISFNSYLINIYVLRRLIILFTILGITSLYILINSQGYIVSDLLSIKGLFLVASNISINRYEETLDLPISYKLLSSFLYTGIFFSAILLHYRKNKLDTLIASLPLLVSLLNAMINGSRAGLLMGILIFLASSILIYLSEGKKFTKMKLIISGLKLILILILILIFIQILRGGSEYFDFSSIVKSMTGYVFGSVNAFSLWWHSHISLKLGLGQYTFSGIFNSLYGGREIGLFSKPVQISDNIITNVYTIFRATIEDFSLLGSLMLTIMLGFLSTLMYYLINRNRFSFVILGMIYSVLFVSYITNPLTYNTILMSWMLNAILIRTIIKFKKEIYYD